MNIVISYLGGDFSSHVIMVRQAVDHQWGHMLRVLCAQGFFSWQMQ